MLNENIVQAITEVRRAVIGPVGSVEEGPMVAQQVGRGIAYEAVAQTTALVIQDAADYMRNVAMLVQAGMAVAATKIIEQPSQASEWTDAIKQLQDIANHGVDFFKSAGAAAKTVVEEYPSG